MERCESRGDSGDRDNDKQHETLTIHTHTCRMRRTGDDNHSIIGETTDGVTERTKEKMRWEVKESKEIEVRRGCKHSVNNCLV